MTTANFDHEPRLTPRFVAEALGVPSPDAREPFTSITTDSRKVQPGCLFVAIPGEKFDGHDFIAQALASGASGVLCRRNAVPPARKGLQIYPVENTLEAYRKLASAWRREFSIPVIAVAGSVGKTTTKEFLAAILRGRYAEVLKTDGSENGFVGIPMTLLKLQGKHGAAVIEVGIDEIGAMDQHMVVVGANAGVLTTIGPEHLEKLRDVPTVAREEGAALIAISHSAGMVAVNLDDPWIRPHYSTLRNCKKIAFTVAPAGDKPDTLYAALAENGKAISVTGLGLKDEKFALPLLGEHNARNLLAAVAVAVGLGLTAEEVRKGLKTFQGPSGRSEIRELAGRTPVICDYYNANPTSTEAGLGLLAQAARERKAKARFACLADMLELGPDEELFHRGLADKLIELGIENVYLYGERMRWLYSELASRGASFKGAANHFTTQAELAKELCSRAKPGDAILIKGSHSMKMEEVWKLLEEHARKNWGT